MNQPSLDDIRLFVSVVQAGSLSQASKLTGVPISRLSRRLTELEKTLGTQLINRGKKGISTNELGERFFLHAKAMLNQANLAIDSIHHGLAKPAGRLRISVATDVAHQYLLPMLHEYLAEFSEVSLDIDFSQQKINLIQDGIDIAIRAGSINNDNAIAKVWFMAEFGIYATQDYLQKYGTPMTPDELCQHKIIAQKLSLPWQFWQHEKSSKISPNSYISCNDFTISNRLIAQGLGIGMLSTHAAAQNPHLIQVLTNWQIKPVPISLVYYKNRGTTPVLQSFINWLIQHAPNKS